MMHRSVTIKAEEDEVLGRIVRGVFVDVMKVDSRLAVGSRTYLAPLPDAFPSLFHRLNATWTYTLGAPVSEQLSR